MKLRRLEISGFKSFADRVVFSFDDGITGVVGPNGCGKSNLVDAIRWAMGEQSAKHLRGRAMEDVIFSGSESRPATGMAEVSLTFQNDGRLVPPQYAGFAEITVARRLFRNGDSEYEINRAACRLLDITELFLGTGVGTRAYSIIEQGRIGLIVSAKPEDRRAIIEEAAGVTKYKARRKQAERKLEATEQNLLRLSEVVGEVRARLQSLERSAKKAERFRELRTQLRDLELLAACAQYLELKKFEEQQARELAEAGESTGVAEAQVARLEAGLSAERLQLLEDEKKVQELAEASHRIDKQLKLTEQEMDFARRERELAVERDELARRLLESQQKRKSLHEQKLATEEELARGRAEQRDLEALLIKLREELADRRSRLTSLLELQKNFEGYGRGVKAIMLRHEEERRRDGIYGLVADVLKVEPRHERALEAVLGERLQLILVESHAAGLRAVDYLRQASQGRASFVPLTEMEQPPLVPEAAALPAPEGTQPAVDAVDCAPEHERLRNYLLSDVFLCDSLATARLLWSRNPGERTFVSADGEVVDKEGVVSGGQLEGVADGLLHKRRDVEELAGTA